MHRGTWSSSRGSLGGRETRERECARGREESGAGHGWRREKIEGREVYGRAREGRVVLVMAVDGHDVTLLHPGGEGGRWS